jgi:hypothetical protein
LLNACDSTAGRRAKIEDADPVRSMVDLPAVSLGLALIASPLMHRPPDGDGGTGVAPEASPEPPWWPHFESDLHAYAARERSRT